MYTTNESTLVTFQCSVTGIPSPVITWYRNGALLPGGDPRISVGVATEGQLSSGVYEVMQNLVIESTVDSDSGTYSCSGSNAAGNDTDSFQLAVQCKPARNTVIMLSSNINTALLML